MPMGEDPPVLVLKSAGPRTFGPASVVVGRADNYRGILENVWDRFWPALSEAQTPEDVVEALKHARPCDREFEPWASLMLKARSDRNFPKRPRAQINFLADSIAALGTVTPRRSRDICMQERTKTKQAHHIVRYEYYVECSCGYEGPAKDRACRKC